MVSNRPSATEVRVKSTNKCSEIPTKDSNRCQVPTWSASNNHLICFFLRPDTTLQYTGPGQNSYRVETKATIHQITT